LQAGTELGDLGNLLVDPVTRIGSLHRHPSIDALDSKPGVPDKDYALVRENALDMLPSGDTA
jgi:hypothetical protein